MVVIDLDNATVENFQALEKRFGSLARGSTLLDAQRHAIGEELGYCKTVSVGDTWIQVHLSETIFGKEELKKLMDATIQWNGGTYYFYSMSFDSVDHGDDMTFGGVEKWTEVEFRLA
jgi:hypothetical protein